jgi:hypothetical protein
MSRFITLPLLLSMLLLAATASMATTSRVEADGSCVFPFTPTTYEDLKDRKLFLDTIDLAAFNMLFPGDEYFGLPDIELGTRDDRHTQAGQVPPVLLKAIAYIESSITQSGSSNPFGSIGPTLIAFDCGHGVAQVTTGMTYPTGEDGRGSPQQALVATHYAYNIARGANILVQKWNDAPEEKPIAGVDTLGHPAVLENWYYAVWAYNGFTGPGASKSNHPLDPIYGEWPRTPYSCGPDDDGLGHNRSNYPYQELVFGCATNPPVVDGEPLWEAQPITLPDLNDPNFQIPLNLDNFVFPYSNMDILTPQPFHIDQTPSPDPALRDKVLGKPELALNTENITVENSGDFGPGYGFVHVFNVGTGVLPYYAVASVPWVTVLPYTGVAVGLDMPCADDSPCDRFGHIGFIVWPKDIPPGADGFQIVVQALGTDEGKVINVSLNPTTAQSP